MPDAFVHVRAFVAVNSVSPEKKRRQHDTEYNLRDTARIFHSFIYFL